MQRQCQGAPDDWALQLLAHAAASISAREGADSAQPSGDQQDGRAAAAAAPSGAASDGSSCACDGLRCAALCAAASSAADAAAPAPRRDVLHTGAHTIADRVALARRFAACLQPCKDNVPGKLYVSDRVLAIAEARDERSRAAAKAPPKLFRLLVHWQGFAVQFSTWESLGKFRADTGGQYQQEIDALRAELLAADVPMLAAEMSATEVRQLMSVRGGTAVSGRKRAQPDSPTAHASAATAWDCP